MTTKPHKSGLLAIVAVVLTLVTTGCGGSDSSSSSTASTGSGSGTETSAAFRKPGSPTNELVELGHEANRSEREAASAVLTKSLSARQNADFAVQCSTLSLKVMEEIAIPQKGRAAKKACPEALRELAIPLSATQAFRRDTLGDETVAVLRVQGNTGEALFHGNDGKDYGQSMSKEGDRWTVAALLTTELNPPESKPKGQSAK